jgi:putative phosphoesterase
MDIALISDTHGLLRPEVLPALAGCRRVLHAGDVGSPDILEALEPIGPVHAVRGNTDRDEWARALPETECVEVAGVTLYMIHILEELDLDPAAAGIDVVVYGHTHRPRVEERDGVLFVNPGSCGPRRFDLPVTVGRLTIDSARGLSVRLVPLSGEAAAV